MQGAEKPWEDAGVGYAEDKVHPVQKVLSLLQENMTRDDFTSHSVLLKNKISDGVWSQILPEKSYDDLAAGDEDLKRRKLFAALEAQYGINKALEMIRSVALTTNAHMSHEGKNVEIAQMIENVLKDEKEYYESLGFGELDSIHFVGRKGFSKKIHSDLNNDSVLGILICGMYGMGKTTLAKKVCREVAKNMELRYIDLRKVSSTEGAFHTIMSGLTRQNSFEYNIARLASVIDQVDKKTLLLLDNADGVMDFQTHERVVSSQSRDFYQLIKTICDRKNAKLKIMITSRFKLAHPEESTVEETSHAQETQRLSGAMTEYSITPLSKSDAIKLLNHELGRISKEQMSYDEKSDLVDACGFSPMAIQLAASQLKNNIHTTIAELVARKKKSFVRSRQAAAPLVTTEFAVAAILRDEVMGSLLAQVFGSLNKEWQMKLMQLSVLESAFDVHAAAACIKCDTIEATLDLQYLHCRHLIDVMDITISSRSVSLHKTDSVRYVIHTLTAQYLQQLHEQDEWQKPLRKAQKRFAVHFGNRLQEIHKTISKQNVLTIYQKLNDNKVHFNNMITLEIDLGIVPKLQRLGQLKRFADSNWLYMWFLDPPRRKTYFQKQADKSLRNRQYSEFCNYALWEVDILVEMNDIPGIQETLQRVGEIMKEYTVDMKQDMKQSTQKIKSVEANFAYMKGRYLFQIGQTDESVQLLKKSRCLYEDLLGDSVTTAQVINMLGAAYFGMGDFRRAKQCHEQAYQMLASVTHGSLHYDTPVYLFNIGTVYQKLGRREKKNGHWKQAESHLRKALKYYDMSLDAYRQQNMFGFGRTIEVLKSKANAKFELKNFEEALKISDQVEAITERTMMYNQPFRGLHIAWVGTMYYDYADEILTKEPNNDECIKMYRIAKDKLKEAGIYVCSNINVPLDDPGYADLKTYYKKVLRKLGKHDKLAKIERKFKEYEEKCNRNRQARNLKPFEAPYGESGSDAGSDTSASESEDSVSFSTTKAAKKETLVQKDTSWEGVRSKEEPEGENENLGLDKDDLEIQPQCRFDSEVIPRSSALKRLHPPTDSSDSSSLAEDSNSLSSSEEELPRWRTCVLL